MRRAVMAGIALMLAPSALAQAPYTPPRTATGVPDLQGVWTADFLTPLERPDDVKDLIVPADKVADLLKKLTPDPGKVYDPDFHYYFPNTLLTVNGEMRSSWIVSPADGRLPVTALARAVMKLDEESRFDNPEERPGSERCTTGLGYPPIHAISAVIPNLIVQTPTALVIATEDTDAARIVDLTTRPRPGVIRTRMGQSTGHWDGDTLIVETDHLAAPDPGGILWRDAALATEGSRIIERFTRLSANEMLYQFTVEDPALYTRPWLAEYVLKRSPERLYEYACHEGNYGMIGSLTAARMGKQKPPKSDDKPDK